MDQLKIGKFIASNRRRTGMTQAQLAERLGVTNKAVSKWETGKCLPDAELFQPLCGILGITVSELLTGEVIPPEQAAEKAEATIVSLAGDRQGRDRWRRSIKYTAYVIGVINMAVNLFGFVLPWVGVYNVPPLPYDLMMLPAILHMVLWGVAMEINREDPLLQWITLIFCAILPVSTGLGIHALPMVDRTYSFIPVIQAGMPCLLLLAGLLQWIGIRPVFYLCIGLSAAGLAVSIRNLTAIRMKNKAARDAVS